MGSGDNHARGTRMMKRFNAKLAIVVIVGCAAGPLLAEEALPLRNCTWCHGPSLEGFGNAPRLAGQKQLYLENQIANFRTHARDNPYSRDFMWNAAANLDQERARAFAVYLAGLQPRAAMDGNQNLTERGRALYEVGVPEANIAACLVCHGPNGEGVRQIPRLSGLSYYYVKRRLEEWDQGYHASAVPMPMVARSLSPNEIDALASYLSSIN